MVELVECFTNNTLHGPSCGISVIEAMVHRMLDVAVPRPNRAVYCYERRAISTSGSRRTPSWPSVSSLSFRFDEATCCRGGPRTTSS